MELTKNYEPKKNINKIKKDSVDFLFPIFLPSYRRISWKSLSWYLNQSIAWKIRSQKLWKKILPCFIRNVDTLWDSLVLENKKDLIFPAKLQRLHNHKDKTYKKILPVFSQIFTQSRFDNIYNFSLTDEKNSEILNKFQEKWLWKKKEKLVYWDITTQSIVEEDAIEWREEEWLKLTIKCFVETKNDVFPLVVDDPTLLFSDVAIIVHSNDKRYKKHIGKNIIVPVINKPIPILASTTIDTIKDNWILRVNPLLSDESLEKVKELWLNTAEDYIDKDWLFIEYQNPAFLTDADHPVRHARDFQRADHMVDGILMGGKVELEILGPTVGIDNQRLPEPLPHNRRNHADLALRDGTDIADDMEKRRMPLPLEINLDAPAFKALDAMIGQDAFPDQLARFLVVFARRNLLQREGKMQRVLLRLKADSANLGVAHQNGHQEIDPVDIGLLFTTELHDTTPPSWLAFPSGEGGSP